MAASRFCGWWLFLGLAVGTIDLANAGAVAAAPRPARRTPAPAPAPAPARGVIEAPSGLFLRARPTRTARSLTRIPHGETVEILDRHGPAETIEGKTDRWYKVRWHQDTGWVFGGFVRPAGAAGKTASPSAPPIAAATALPQASSAAPVGGGGARARPAAPVVVPVDGPAGLGPKDEQLVEEETAYLKACAPTVTRQGKSLQIKLKNGRSLTFTDDASAEENAELYYFRGYLRETGFFLLYRVGWEFANYLLVDEQTGARVTIDENPVFSPSGERFVTACLDLEAGFVPNGLKIYRVAKGKVTLEWSVSPSDWGPSDPRWKGEHLIEFQKVLRGGQTTKPGRIVYNPKTKHWSLAP
ncbi:MAG: hypothetical protein OZSIB_1866 [Candidatus Ozemobacter sibiricus]|jgi:uncharacterized protein YgiM (DUF1202 family)|uniref:SH3b domain-containing protein n=1 Tax=Candidatus Ozemobacter sibiricus TaxID=2268124 RepID=A0A367ZJ80_9BACT|nr:MAG: hypothetical protein OZSIB_1866 [Candidatus Ozemobacter sibiricus]